MLVQPGLQYHGGGGGIYFVLVRPRRLERVLHHRRGVTFIGEFYRQTETPMQLVAETPRPLAHFSLAAIGRQRQSHQQPLRLPFRDQCFNCSKPFEVFFFGNRRQGPGTAADRIAYRNASALETEVEGEEGLGRTHKRRISNLPAEDTSPGISWILSFESGIIRLSR